MKGYSNYMYDQIKNDISQEYYLKNYPNNGQRFVAWYLRNCEFSFQVQGLGATH